MRNSYPFDVLHHMYPQLYYDPLKQQLANQQQQTNKVNNTEHITKHQGGIVGNKRVINEVETSDAVSTKKY